MKPGEIYRIYFRYAPPKQDEGKYRPALIVSVHNDQALAIALKITKSKPNKKFPNRIPILNWRSCGLTDPSYVEFDQLASLPLSGKYQYVGTMHPMDFQNVLKCFKEYFGV